jgi:hypothetical protein
MEPVHVRIRACCGLRVIAESLLGVIDWDLPPSLALKLHRKEAKQSAFENYSTRSLWTWYSRNLARVIDLRVDYSTKKRVEAISNLLSSSQIVESHPLDDPQPISHSCPPIQRTTKQRDHFPGSQTLFYQNP